MLFIQLINALNFNKFPTKIKFQFKLFKNIPVQQQINYMRQFIKVFLIIFLLSKTLEAQCPSKCLECDPSGTICFACDEGLSINVFGQCNENTIQNCVIYGPSGECFNCEPTFKLEGDKCVKDYTGCILSNSNDGTCFECGFGTRIQGNICTGVINCKQFNGVCQECRGGYVLTSNICRDISQGCARVRNSDGLCQSCLQDYNYVGYKCIHKNVTVPRCYIYNQTASCLSCQNGFKLYEGKCLITSQIQEEQRKKAQKQNQGVQNCQVPDVINPGNCLVCVYGYYPSNNQCVEVSKFCGEHNVQTGDCFDCKFGLKLDDGKCFDNNCEFSNPDGTCGTCKNPYRPNQNGVCEFNDPNCIQKFNSRCQKCVPRFYVDSEGKCQLLPPNCRFANFQTGACLQCEDGYKPNNGACLKEIKIQNCQVPDPVNPGICVVCIFGYFPSGNACLKVSPLCGNHNVQNGDCLDCANENLKLQGGQCIDQNCFSREANGDCRTCRQNFIYNRQELICKLNDPNCDRSNSEGCIICRNGFYVSQQSICKPLPQNCLQANPQESCVTCVNNYRPANGVCVPSVNIPNCRTPDPFSGRCSLCENGYDQINGQCVKQFIPPVNPPTQPTGGDPVKSTDPNCLQSVNGICSQCSLRYYVSENKCVPINPLCQTHNNRGQCTTCYRGYSLNDGKCQLGIRSDSNCKTTTNGICSECYKGFYYNNNDRMCKRVNPLCKTSNSFTGKCETCYPGYQLNANAGSCDVFFRDPNCKTFDGNNFCELCSQRYYLSSNNKCTPVNPLCLDYDMRTGSCTDCYKGYQVNNGLCTPSSLQDANCKTFNNGYCIQCYKRFYVKNGKCESVNPNCKDYNMNNGNCDSCYPGYFLDDGECEEGQDRDQNCKDFSPSNTYYCVQCYQGFLPLNGKCEKKNPLCQTVNQTNGDCLTCWRGYIQVRGDCLIESEVQPRSSSGQVDPYCIKLVNGICDECSQGFFFDRSQGKCKQADPLCKTYDNQTGFCTSCWIGYSELQGKCVIATAINIPYCQTVSITGICSQCIDNYYLKNNKCEGVSILCGGDYHRSTGQCRSCVSGYFLQSGQCIFPAIFDARCTHYTSAYCDSCQPGYILENYQCSPLDSQCTMFDYDAKVCRECANGKRPVGRDCV